MLDSELPKTIFPLFISDDILEIVPIDASKFAESFVLVCILSQNNFKSLILSAIAFGYVVSIYSPSCLSFDIIGVF